MSLTRTVPAAVPSLFHSSRPCAPSSAVKYSVPSTFVRSRGIRSRPPGLMSLPARCRPSVPSLFHSSSPCTPSSAREVQRAVHVRQRRRSRSRLRRADVLTQDGAGGRAVALPQLAPLAAVVGGEEQRPAHVRQEAARSQARAGADVLDQRRCRPRCRRSSTARGRCTPSSAVKNSVPFDVRQVARRRSRRRPAGCP